MSRFAITAPVIILAAAATPAAAQDAADWSGVYVGVHGTMSDVDADWTGTNIYQSVDGAEGGFTTSQTTNTFSHRLSGSEIGGSGRVGFNFQTGSFVIGAEADAMFFNFTEGVTVTTPRTTYTLVSDASNLQTVRARAGFAAGRALFFVTGGVAFSNLEHSLTATNVNQIIIDGGEGGGSAIGTSSSTLAATAGSGTGVAFGGGGEFQINDSMSVALTALRIDFGSEDLADSAPPSSISAMVDSKMVVGMIGLNLRF
jgi:outer membrane immunogenic protein